MGRHHNDDTKKRDERREIKLDEHKFNQSRNEKGLIVKIIAGLIVVGLLGFLAKNIFLNSDSSSSGQTQEIIKTEVEIVNGTQIVPLSFLNKNYYPSTITVKSGIPVRIVADVKRIQGCFRAINIPNLGIQKYFYEKGKTLDFTPDKPGIYRFSCTMGMGSGTLVVQ